MSGHFPYGPDRAATSDETRFSCAARSGRRKADAFGHLVLTRASLEFHGSHDVRVAWSEVARITRVEDTLIVALQHTRRRLHFACQTAEDAAKASAVASAALAERQPAQPHVFA